MAAKNSGGWFSTPFCTADHLVAVQDLSPAAPDNLYLLSNVKGWSTWHAHRTKSTPTEAETLDKAMTDQELAHVAAYIRNGLGDTNDEWVVCVDSGTYSRRARARSRVSHNSACACADGG